MYAFFVLMSIQQKIIMSCKSFAEHGRSCVGISLEQPDKAKPIIDLLRGHDSLEIMEWSKQRTSGMEERKLRSLAASSLHRVNARGYGIPVWPARLAEAAGQQLAPRGRRRAGWQRRPRCGGPSGVGAGGEESAKNARKKMALVYICHTPLLPVPSPHRE